MTGLRKTVAMVAALTALALSPAHADSVATSTDNGFGRLTFTFDAPTTASAAITSGVVTVTFSRKVTLDPAQVTRAFETYASTARLDPNGLTLRIALSQDAKLHTSKSANRFALDLMPAGFQGTPPDLPPPPPKVASAVDVAKLPPLAIRAGAYSNFSRLVFDWSKNVPYAVFPGSGHITIRFETQARPDFTAFERIAPPWVKEAGWRVENGGTVLEFSADPGSRYHDFRDGNNVVLDILSPKSDAEAYKPPGLAKGIALKGLTGKLDPAKAAAAAQAIADAAKKPDQKTAAATPPQTQAQQPAPQTTPAQAPAAQTPATQTAAAQTPATTPATPATPDAQNTLAQTLAAAPISAGAQRTRGGAVVTFANAAAHPSAVFERGATVWIVLDGAPPVDIAKLRTALGDFPSSVDVSSNNGTSLVRITLKQPEPVAADAVAGNLKVTIAPQIGTQPIAIGFVRNDDAPNGAYLTTLVPGALRSIMLPDPVVGDSLVVIPAIPGRGVVTPKTFVDFTAIPSASGLVISPSADDLAVAVNQSRIRIGRPNGLVLNASIAASPTSPSDLTRPGDGPTFVNFAAWGKAPGKDFIDSERRLRTKITQQKTPQDVNHARLVLARFLLAHQFAAEALGVIDLMQITDPSLQGNPQLQIIRATSDYMMGRYREAHNILSAAAFDNDPHAAVWRGLTESALGNQQSAQQSLSLAEEVIGRYPTDWQSRARIAQAQAALAAGSLETADAALAKLPHDLPTPLLLASEIERAKLYARENRKRDAFALFDAVENGNDDHMAALAIYAHVEAGLETKTMTPDTAIAMLEKLRYRWRGDALELNTLRKLGALYFQTKHWREGLGVLRTASQNFPEDEMARHAQDDMRGAFAQLFLHGGADKMSPVQALALFYDFIDLTPIGPDGDEMIRRMSDRLMAVDLLGPAAKLLDYQVNQRLTGVAQAQVAAKLAMIQLLDHKPKDALASIRGTRVAGLPDDVNHQRMILEARALAALKQWDAALDVIAVDEQPDSQRLRADIYWESGNWAVAGQKAEALLGDNWNGATALSDDDRTEVMRAAIAYSLANDENSLDRLRDHFAAKMKASKDASAFAVVTQNIGAQGAAFRDQAGQIASIDTLESFMKDFKKRYAGDAVN